MNQHTTIAEPLEVMLCIMSVPRLYSNDQWEKSVSGLTLGGGSSNTSTIALQVIGGNEKGVQCLGV
jgi:hypothetical protein